MIISRRMVFLKNRLFFSIDPIVNRVGDDKKKKEGIGKEFQSGAIQKA